MDDQEAEGICPSKKSYDPSLEPQQTECGKVFTVIGQNANVMNPENTKLKGQLTWDDRWKEWPEEKRFSVLICHSEMRGDSPNSGRIRHGGIKYIT